MSDIDLISVLDRILPLLQSISEGIVIKKDFKLPSMMLRCNSSLLESMINNLIVNALKHNRVNGEIVITVDQNKMVISNTSDKINLDEKMLFNRFCRPIHNIKGNGLGLAIVKAICDYHKWIIEYKYADGKNNFIVTF